MTTLAKWNPFHELETLQRRVSSMFGRTSLFGNGGETFKLAEWEPLVDITEDDKEFLIKAELPDMKKEDVKVTIEEGAVRITGDRKFEKEEKGKTFHRIERAYGSFDRAFALPDGTKPEALTAEYNDGVLSVHLPKTEIVKPKAVEIKVT